MADSGEAGGQLCVCHFLISHSLEVKIFRFFCVCVCVGGGCEGFCSLLFPVEFASVGPKGANNFFFEYKVYLAKTGRENSPTHYQNVCNCVKGPGVENERWLRGSRKKRFAGMCDTSCPHCYWMVSLVWRLLAGFIAVSSFSPFLGVS